MAYLVVAACGGDGDGKADAAVNDTPDADTTPDAAPVPQPHDAPWFNCPAEDAPGATVVVGHDKADQYFNHGDDRRNVDAEVTFPSGDWQKVLMRVELDCPASGRCDVWDRAASISLVEDEGDSMKRAELARYMTPYGRGFCFVADLSDVSTLLTGTKKLRSFIDTWSPQGDSRNGDGWRVTTKFMFYPRSGGATITTPEIIPLWNNQAEDRLVRIGDPAQPVSGAVPPRTVTIPADARKVELRYIITGHGQGGAYNCAEFCQLQYLTLLGASSVQVTPWRDDCDKNPVSPQNGTWLYPRAGWCPGAYAAPTIIDVTDKVTPGTTTEVAFAIHDATGNDFVNTCRPGAGDANNVCRGCVARPNQPGNCEENGNGHTPAEARISVQMLVYR